MQNNLKWRLGRRRKNKHFTRVVKQKNYDSYIKWGTLSASILALAISYLAFMNSVDSKKISNRAYVVVENVKYNSMPGLERGHGVDNFDVDILVRNVGQTPAYNTEIKSAMNIYGPDFIHSPEFDDNLMGNRILINGSEYSFRVKNIHPFSSAEINSINDKNSFIYVYGIILYKDIFNDAHSTKFCFRMESLTFNGFKLFKTFNDAD